MELYHPYINRQGIKIPPDWAVCLDTDNYLVLFLLVTASAILNNAENTSKIK